MGLQAYLEAIVESDVLGQPGNTPLSETRPKAMEGQIGGLCRGRAS